MTSQDSDALRRALLIQLAARRGYYQPPEDPRPPSPAVMPKPEPTGFGRAMQQAGRGLGVLTSGENAANAVGNAVGAGNVGTNVRQQIERVPVVGKPLAWAADVATSPLTIATAGFGAAAGAGIRAATAGTKAAGFGRFLAPVVEPLATGPLPYRIGAAVAGSAGAELGDKAAETLGLPEPVQAAFAIGGGILGAGSVGNMAKRAALNAGGLSPEVVAQKLASGDPIDKLTVALSQSKTDFKNVAKERSAELGRRMARAEGIIESQGLTDYDQIGSVVMKSAAGKMPSGTLELPEAVTFSPDDILAIKTRVGDYFSNPLNFSGGRKASEARVIHRLDGATANGALNKILTGEIPTPSEIGLLERALGTEFGQVLTKATEQRNGLKTVLEVMGVPRAVMSSFDVSMPLRQGGILYSRKEWRDSWKPMFKALVDEDNFRAIQDDIVQDMHPMTRLLAKKGTLTGFAAQSKDAVEEQFMNAYLAEVIPGVRASERGAVAFLNKLRNDYAKNIFNGWESKGVEITPKMMGDLADWTAIVTGRGPIPEQLGKNIPALMSSLFFSPKFLSSRIAMLNPKTYLDLDPLVRREAMRDMVAYFAPGVGAVGALGLAAKAGVIPGVSVETSPLSSDFGKVRVGNTRLDPWAGFQPIVRYAAQLATGTAKYSSGEINDRNRVETAGNFIRSKMAPVPSFVVDALTGNSFVGQEVDVASGQGLDRAAAERLAPLFAQDMAEAIATGNPFSIMASTTGLVGFGAQTYDSKAAIRAQGAAEMFGKNPDTGLIEAGRTGATWAELSGEKRRAVDEKYAEELARQRTPAENTAAGFIDKTNVEIRGREQQLAKALSEGQINNSTFTAAMNDLQAERVNRNKAVSDFTGAFADRAPSLLDDWFALREKATVNGIVDYQLLDQLQHEFRESQDEIGKQIIDERVGFQHVKEVQWWVDAKKKIQDSGYYQSKSQAMEALTPLLKALGAEGMTYSQLVSAAISADSPAQAAILAGVMKRVDTLSQTYQKVLRARDPELDQSLALVYGSTPLLMRRR